jgi:ABC-type Fe2+-enterobactin transport system substrate-binding protein
MDPIKLREAFGLPPDATDDDLEAVMAADPDLIRISGSPEEAAVSARSLRAAQRVPERSRGPWLELESRAVSRTALELLELWTMARTDHADFEMTSITAMDQLSKLTKHDLMRVAATVACMAVHVLTTDHERGRLAEQIMLEISMITDGPDQ